MLGFVPDLWCWNLWRCDVGLCGDGLCSVWLGVGVSDVGLFGVEPCGVGLCVGGDIGMVGGDGAGVGETQHPFSHFPEPHVISWLQ